MVAALDEAVGNISAALQQAGLWDNTVLIFTTDNGAPASHFNGTAMSNDPLRGEKVRAFAQRSVCASLRAQQRPAGSGLHMHRAASAGARLFQPA